MAAKLEWEWADNCRDIIVRKKKGKLTYDEVFRFMHEPEMMNMFEGCLVLTTFRVNKDRDMWSYMDDYIGESAGDSQELMIIGDDTVCPICNEHRLFPQYCPECGHELKVKKNGR